MIGRPQVPVHRLAVGLLVLLAVLLSPGTTIARLDETGGFQETRFWVGCQPGPVEPPSWPDPVLDHAAAPAGLTTLDVQVDLDSAARHRPILGSGFNFEHALWSCPAYRGVLDSELLRPFQPALARVDSGMLPAAPDFLPAKGCEECRRGIILSSARRRIPVKSRSVKLFGGR